MEATGKMRIVQMGRQMKAIEMLREEHRNLFKLCILERLIET